MARAKKAETVAVFRQIGENEVGDDAILWSALGRMDKDIEETLIAVSKKGVLFIDQYFDDEDDYRIGAPLDSDMCLYTPAATRALANALLFAADVAESGVRPTA